jgi:hypothetical protein
MKDKNAGARSQENARLEDPGWRFEAKTQRPYDDFNSTNPTNSMNPRNAF